MRLGRSGRAIGTGALAILLTAGLVAPSAATSNRGWQVTADSTGVMYGTTDADTIGAVRAWEAATWCTVQPSPDADMQAILASTLGAQLDAQIAQGATTAIVGLGHPPAWVFGNDPRGSRHVVQYGCSANAAAAVSIPSYASLKRAKNGTLPAQAQRWNAYVGAVIDFVDARYGQSIKVLLQVWNEPNLTSGLRVDTKVKGSSRTVKDAVNALYELERITRDAVTARGNPAITLTSTALFQRPNDFFKLYLAKQAKKPVVSSLAFNVYGAPTKNPDAMVKEWNYRVERIKKLVNKYAKLRKLPVIIGETTLNLVNNTHNKTNLTARIIAPGAQVRMATAVQMDAYYHGFRAVYWLSGPQRQTAVLIGYAPGTPARAALGVLRGQLLGLRIDGCSSKSGTRSCTFRDPAGARPTVKVYWRASGSKSLTLARGGTVVRMSGETVAVPPRGKVAVGTTPIVVAST